MPGRAERAFAGKIVEGDSGAREHVVGVWEAEVALDSEGPRRAREREARRADRDGPRILRATGPSSITERRISTAKTSSRRANLKSEHCSLPRVADTSALVIFALICISASRRASEDGIRQE